MGFHADADRIHHGAVVPAIFDEHVRTFEKSGYPETESYGMRGRVFRTNGPDSIGCCAPVSPRRARDRAAARGLPGFGCCDFPKAPGIRKADEDRSPTRSGAGHRRGQELAGQLGTRYFPLSMVDFRLKALPWSGSDTTANRSSASRARRPQFTSAPPLVG